MTTRLRKIFMIATIVANSSYAQIIISEVQSSNDQTCTNEIGESADWVEIYNDGEESVDLSGWGLSDNVAKPFKWTFPQGALIEGGGRILVFADSLTEDASSSGIDELLPNSELLNSDLVGWFVADDFTAEGWRDRSSFANDALNTTVSQLPTKIEKALNGHSVIHFDSTKKQKLYLPRENFNGMESLDNVTVILVAKWSGLEPVATGRGLFGHSMEVDATTNFDIQKEGALRIRNGLPGHDVKTISAINSGEWFTAGFTSNSELETPLTSLFVGEGTINRISSEIGDVSLTQEPGAFAGLMIGNSSLRYDRHFDGDMAEVIIFRRALTALEYAGVVRYLENKYQFWGEKKLHASFSLSADGETLVLTKPGEIEPEDALSFGKIPCDASYGRTTDGLFAYFAEPTPAGENNTTSYSAPLDPVQFSHTRGVYEEAFDLALSHSDQDATIIYTLDNSEPSLTKGIVYTPGVVIHISNTTVVRAAAFKEGALPTKNLTSHSYIFLEDILTQEKPEGAPNTWKDEGSTPASYSISAAVVKDDETKQALFESIKSAPIVSIALDNEELFNPSTGLYCKPVTYLNQEKEASVEWVTGDNILGIEAGLRMQGNYARRFSESPKKSFRLAFRSRYGAGKLKAPVLKKGGCDSEEFNTLILRGEHNYAWHAGSSKGTSMHDQFVRDLQGQMSGFECHGSHIHLFINGLYWGLYNVSERLDADYAAGIWGGEKRDYDVIKNGASNIGQRGFQVRDGSDVEFRDLFSFVSTEDLSQKEKYETVKSRLDVVQFADYMILEYYVGNTDWPNNNWLCFRSAANGLAFRYMLWDAELSMASETENRITSDSGSYSSPQKFQRRLELSKEYRILFADRVYKHMYGNGALTTENLVATYDALADKVRPLVFGEAARWGAYWHENRNASTPIFDLSTWDAERKRITKTFFPNRRQKFFDQLRAAGLFPSYVNPLYIRVDDTSVKIDMKGQKTIYYTTDGSDPRVAYEGSVNPVARIYIEGETISVENDSVVKARALSDNGEWSALMEIDLKGSAPIIRKNMFLPSTNGENWDKAANWSEGYYPNEPGSYAVIGVPTAFKKDKGWRNIHINKSDVTIGRVDITSGGCTNRIDTGKSGNLTFCGKLDENGVALEDATFVVLDENDTSLSMIDLDEPNKVILGSDTEFVVSNIVGDVMWGGLLAKGVWDGAGHNLAKSGAGRMTLDVTNAPETSFGKIQVAEGSIDITKKVYAEAITKDGTCSAALGSTDLATAIDEASVLSDKVSVNNVRLFIPSYVGGATYYGAFVANSLTTTNAKKGKTATAYIRDNEGDTWFNEKRYRLLPEVEVKTKTLDDGRVTYSVKAPMQDVTVIVDANGKENVPEVELSTEEAIRCVKDSGKIVIKGASEIAVDNTKHTIIVDGATYTVADYYDAKIVGKWIQLAFNENAVPRYAESEVGAHDALVIGEDGVSLGVQTKVGLSYTIQSRASLSEGDWVDVRTVHGNGAVQKLDAEKLGVGGFYRVVVTDK